MSVKRQTGMYERFDRSGKPTRGTHYCPGCGHGIINKLIAEVVDELKLEDRVIYVDPVGCGVFTYYYWDGGHISAAHGRASAAATGATRARPGSVVLAYQGDGDLGAIGFNNAFQAASRGEHIAVIFVNNAIYGMTGGQMAPTTLVGQKTKTSPWGRDPLTSGYPLHACEVFNALKAPVYIARVSVADTKRIMAARAAIKKAIEIQRDGKGYAFVEILSPCPTNLGADALKSAAWVIDSMEKEFPLGTLRDDTLPARAAARQAEEPAPLPIKPMGVAAYFGGKPGEASAPAAEHDAAFQERRFKFAGYGGQGILSLGITIAEAARIEKRFTLWFPSYGPEQRGGSASCSVVVSGTPIGAPTVEHPDVLVCMNQPSVERFAKDVPAGGLIVVDATVPAGAIHAPAGVKVVMMPAITLAEKLGVPKAANTMMLAALTKLDVTGLSRENLLQALDASFKKKPELAVKNRELFKAAEDEVARILQAERN